MDKLKLKPRPGVYELYWKFAYERQKIFEARLHGLPQPWTNDPILEKYKFCNVYRACDRVSQYMIEQVCYNPAINDPKDRLFQIIAFRIFSNEATWNSVVKFFDHSPTIANLADGGFEEALNNALNENGKLYTHAFILCANDVYGRSRKHLNHVELFKDMFVKHDLGGDILAAKSLHEVYDLLHSYPLIGDFMAYQISIDLNYSEYVNFSENDFTKAGPGALRGINKVFESTGTALPEEVIMWMVEHQDEEFRKLGLDFKGLFGRRLHAIDCQGLFCETDKFCRVARPEIASTRSKIKTKFQQNTRPIELFFPPKWEIRK